MCYVKCLIIFVAIHTIKSKNVQRSAGSLRNNVMQDKEGANNASATLSLKGYGHMGLKVNNAQERIGAYWPFGIVPYYINNTDYDYVLTRKVRYVMNYLETVSCVVFKPYLIPPTEEYSWLYIGNPHHERKCVHETRPEGRGKINLVLGYECLNRRQILHSILHGIGLKDEVTHPLRDQFVRILWDNIHPEYRSLFRINTEDLQTKTMVEYDPMSVMHFHDRAFSQNGKATIAPLVPGLLIQPSEALSQLDQMKIRLMFSQECNKRHVEKLLDSCKNALHTNKKVIEDNQKDRVEENTTTEDVASDVLNKEIESEENNDSEENFATETDRLTTTGDYQDQGIRNNKIKAKGKAMIY